MDIETIAARAPSAMVPYNDILGEDFESASRAVLKFLRERLGFGLWMVTRTNHDDWIVLAADDVKYNVHDGALFRWSDSFCSRMVRGDGPRVAPTSAQIPTYVSAPIGKQVPIGAYIGVPIAAPDGGLFGTLCAIDPEPQPDTILIEQPLVELLAHLLGTVLTNELSREEERRRAERAELESELDALTGLPNRRGWDRVLRAEEARARRYGATPLVAAVDLDELKMTNDSLGHRAGDEIIRRASSTLLSIVRDSDYVARLGGDEFGMICVEEGVEATALRGRILDALQSVGIAASVGAARRHPVGSLQATWERADAAMYQMKRTRQAARTRRG